VVLVWADGVLDWMSDEKVGRGVLKVGKMGRSGLAHAEEKTREEAKRRGK